MNQIAEQLKTKAPQMVAAMQLKSAAYGALARASRDPIIAHDGFVETVLGDAAMLAALIGSEAIRAQALLFLQKARADMVAGGAAKQKDDGPGHGISDAHSLSARSPSASLPGEGQNRFDSQTLSAQPRQTLEGGGGRLSHVIQIDGASPPSPNASSGGQVDCVPHSESVPAAVVHPEPRRGASAIAAMQRSIQESWLLRYRVPNGSEPMRTPISALSLVRRRLMRETGDHFHGMVVVRALEIATARFAEANPNATPLDVLGAEEIAAIETATTFEKVKLKAADWIRKYPELETADAE